MSNTDTMIDQQNQASVNDITEIEGVTPDVLVAREAQVRNALTSLREAEAQILNLLTTVTNIRKMLPVASVEQLNGTCESPIDVSFVPFSHVGKEVRNKLMTDLHADLEAVDDSIKATWRSIKNIKRYRLTEDQIDQLIIGNRL